MDCIFCKIVKGEIPSYTIYEDDQVKLFLNIDPLTSGDMLLIPKAHYTDINDIDSKLLTHMSQTIKNLYHPIKEKLKSDGLTLTQNNEYDQEIKHFHIHLTPRYLNDQLKQTSNKETLLTIEEVSSLLQGITKDQTDAN